MKALCPPRVKEIVKVALPCFLEQFLNVFSGVVSTMIVGRLGAHEMTAVAMSNTLTNWIQCVFVGLSAGTTIVVGRLYGMKDEKNVKKTTLQAIKLSFLLGIVIMLGIILFQTQLVNLFYGSADKKVIENLSTYLFLAMLGMPAVAGMNALSSCLRGTGDNKTPFYTAMIANVVNVILCFTMVDGVGALGIPPMGIFGAGVAITAARYIGLIFQYIFVMTKRKHILPKKYELGFDADVIGKLSKVGVPSAAEQFIFNGGFVIIQAIFVGFGTTFQAGYQIGTNVSGMMQTVSASLNVSAVSLISQCLGAKRFDDAQEYIKSMSFIIYTAVTFIAAVVFISSPWISAMYSTEAEVIEEGIFFMRVFALLMLPIAHMQMMTGVLKGAGDVKYIMVTNVVALWLFRILSIWAISKFFGNPYIAFVVGHVGDFVPRAVMYDRRVRKGDWMYIRI